MSQPFHGSQVCRVEGCGRPRAANSIRAYCERHLKAYNARKNELNRGTQSHYDPEIEQLKGELPPLRGKQQKPAKAKSRRQPKAQAPQQPAQPPQPVQPLQPLQPRERPLVTDKIPNAVDRRTTKDARLVIVRGTRVYRFKGELLDMGELTDTLEKMIELYRLGGYTVIEGLPGEDLAGHANAG